MKGIEPPSPISMQSFSKKRCEAVFCASCSQGASSGAFQPAPPCSGVKVTLAPYGGSASKISLSAAPAASTSVVGGTRSETFTAVKGRSTFPASFSEGTPSTPVIERAGFQVRASTCSGPVETAGCMPPAHGNLL